MVTAVVKRYETKDSEFNDWAYNTTNYPGIYNKMMEITDGDHEIASDAASWCELASVGEIYEFREGEIEIQDIE